MIFHMKAKETHLLNNLVLARSLVSTCCITNINIKMQNCITLVSETWLSRGSNRWIVQKVSQNQNLYDASLQHLVISDVQDGHQRKPNTKNIIRLL